MGSTGAESSALSAVHTILSVDDLDSNRYVRKRALTAAGFRVIEATSGADAIKLAVEEQPALVVLDIRLPDIDGFRVCERLKSDPKTASIAVLLISAMGQMESDLPAALQHQSDAYLREPVAPETLVATTKALLRAREAERRQREAEERARRAERQAGEFLENIADPVIAFDGEWRCTYVSSRAAQSLGRPREELLGRHCRDLYPDDDGTLLSTCERVRAENAPLSLERFSPRSARWSVAHIYPYESGVSIQWRDITERKRIEETLHNTQERVSQQLAELEALYRSAPVGLCVLDDQLRWVRLNQRMAEMNGVPIEAHIGKTPREILPDVSEQAEAALRHILETGEPLLDFEMSGTTRAQPGVLRYWIERWTPLKNDQGRIVGISVAAEEITERKRAEEALRESEERFRTLADNIAQLAWMADANGWVFWYNRRWYEYTGTTFEEIKGWGWQRVHHPDHVSRVVALIKHC